MDIKTNRVIKDTKVELQIGEYTLHGETYSQLTTDSRLLSLSINHIPKKGEMTKGGSGHIRASTFEELDEVITFLAAASKELKAYTEKL